MSWNWDNFSEIGYLSVLLWLAAILLCLIYWKKPARLIATLALGLSVAAFVCAKINSETYVNHIQLDRSEELAKQAAQEEARQRAIVESRGEEVAQIRFAEDGAGDFLDRAGMDEADLKYFESQGGFGEPAWKQEKKSRSAGGQGDGDLDSEIGGERVIGGIDSGELETEPDRPAVTMVEADLVRANRFDLLNLRIARILIVVALVVVLMDYLRRANLYGKASRPLPLPSSWLNALTPMPGLVVSSKRCRKSARGELARIVRRGDSFIYLTDDPTRASKLPSAMRRFPLLGGNEDLIHVDGEISDAFIFETVWYGRSSFVIDSEARANQALRSFLSELRQRKAGRARVSQTAHIVWDLQTPMPEQTRQLAANLAEATGFSVLILRDRAAGAPGSPEPDPEGNPLPSS